MQTIIEEKCVGGKLDILEDTEKHLFMAIPQGFINPPLVKEDLDRARSFGTSSPVPWTYCTNSEHVRLVNPFNLMYLKEIKKIPKLKEFVVFVPGPINRFLLTLARPLVRPDRIIKHRDEFQAFLRQVH